MLWKHQFPFSKNFIQKIPQHPTTILKDNFFGDVLEELSKESIQCPLAVTNFGSAAPGSECTLGGWMGGWMDGEVDEVEKVGGLMEGSMEKTPSFPSKKVMLEYQYSKSVELIKGNPACASPVLREPFPPKKIKGFLFSPLNPHSKRKNITDNYPKKHQQHRKKTLRNRANVQLVGLFCLFQTFLNKTWSYGTIVDGSEVRRSPVDNWFLQIFAFNCRVFYIPDGDHFI